MASQVTNGHVQIIVEFITSNDSSVGCPIIYTDTIHDSILFIDTS